MAVHDWSRVGSFLFKDFRHSWLVTLKHALNDGRLPAGYYAMFEKAHRRNRVAVHGKDDRRVSVVEIVLPASKATTAASRRFVASAWELLREGTPLMVIDVLPRGVQPDHAIWSQLTDSVPQPGPTKQLSVVSYQVTQHSWTYLQACYQPVAIGSPLADMPLFLGPRRRFVSAPLNASYETAVAAIPERWREVLEGPS